VERIIDGDYQMPAAKQVAWLSSLIAIKPELRRGLRVSDITAFITSNP
jgi:hypothetical protein